MTDGRPTDAFVTAAVYLVARDGGHPCPVSRIVEPLDVDCSQVQRYIGALQIQIDREFELASAADYLRFLERDLGLSESTVSQAAGILIDRPEGRKQGANPVGFTAAALYVAADGEITQRELARAAGITTETVRVRLNDLRRFENYE